MAKMTDSEISELLGAHMRQLRWRNSLLPKKRSLHEWLDDYIQGNIPMLKCFSCGDMCEKSEMIQCEKCHEYFCEMCDEGGMCRNCRESN